MHDFLEQKLKTSISMLNMFVVVGVCLQFAALVFADYCYQLYNILIVMILIGIQHILNLFL